MAASTARKLGIKPATTVLVLGPGAADARAIIGALPENTSITNTGTVGDLVILFADSVADVRDGAAPAYASVVEGGRCWIAYRKGGSKAATADGAPPLHRDTLQAALAASGHDGVTLISLNEVWSAMRIKRV